jgi:hypothetical protein
MRTKILSVVALALGAAALVGVASAGSSTKQQRIAIALHDKSSTFALTPLTSGPIRHDSGKWSACCYTRHFVTRDGQSIEIDNPKLTFEGERGTFRWRALVMFVDLDNNYTVANATWKIVRGTGAYAHLKGHGRQAFVQRTSGTNALADEAEGVVDLRH